MEIEEFSDERIDQSYQIKRSSYHSPPDSLQAKRTKTSTNSRPNEFSKAEKIMLRGTAEMLNISMEQLLAVTGTSRSASSNGTSFESDYDSSSCSEAIDGALPDIATTPFALKLPDISQRARQNSSLHKSTTQYPSPAKIAEDSDGVNSAVIPWVSGLPDLNQEPEFWDDFIPTGTCEEDSAPYMNNIWTNIEQDNWFNLQTTQISPLPREALDSLPVDKPHHSCAPLANPPALQLPGFKSQHPNPDSPITISYQSKAGVQTPSMQDKVRKRPKERSINIEESSKSGAKRKRRPFQDLEQRQETSLTRRLRACIRCRMQRIRVGYVISYNIY
jgi:hypothetical protein